MTEEISCFTFMTPSGNEISCKGDRQFVEQVVNALKPIIAQLEKVSTKGKKSYTSPKLYAFKKEELTRR